MSIVTKSSAAESRSCARSIWSTFLQAVRVQVGVWFRRRDVGGGWQTNICSMMRSMSHSLQTQSRTSVARCYLPWHCWCSARAWRAPKRCRMGHMSFVRPTAAGTHAGSKSRARGRESAIRPSRLAMPLTLAAVGTFPAFEVKLRGPAQPASDDIRINARTPIFVMADTPRRIRNRRAALATARNRRRSFALVVRQRSPRRCSAMCSIAARTRPSCCG